MTMKDLCDAVLGYKDSHGGAFPKRAFIDILTADAVSGGDHATIFHPVVPFLCGYKMLGVDEWFVDPRSDGQSVRFE